MESSYLPWMQLTGKMRKKTPCTLGRHLLPRCYTFSFVPISARVQWPFNVKSLPLF